MTQSIAQNERRIEASSFLITKVALLSVPVKDRALAMAEVHQIAVALNGALSDPNLDTTNLQTLIMRKIAESHSKYGEIASTILYSAGQLVEAELASQYANLPADSKGRAAVSLVRAVTVGVVKASEPSAPQPAAMLGGTSQVLRPAARWLWS